MATAKGSANDGSSTTMQDRLERLRKRMGDVPLGGDRGFWGPKSGRNHIRILPPVGDMEVFFQEVGRHYNLPGGANEYCPSFTTSGKEECPICQLVDELYRGGKQDKALAGKLRVRKAFYMNVVVRDARNSADDQGPLIYTPGVTVFKSLQTLIGDADYGDISDAKSGTDLVVIKTGEGMNTEYEVSPKRNASPLSADKAQVAEWLKAAKPITVAVLSEDTEEDEELGGDAMIALLPYERILEKYGLGPGVDVDDLLEELEVEDEEPRHKASTKKRAEAVSTAKAKVKTKPEPAEVEVDEDEEDADEEEEDEDEVGAELKKRTARRHR